MVIFHKGSRLPQVTHVLAEALNIPLLQALRKMENLPVQVRFRSRRAAQQSVDALTQAGAIATIKIESVVQNDTDED